MDEKVVHARWLLFLNVVRLAATCDRLFSVLQYQITKNRSAANLDLINLIISGPDTKQRASKAGVYASGIGANGQKMTPAKHAVCCLRFVSSLKISNPGPRKTGLEDYSATTATNDRVESFVGNEDDNISLAPDVCDGLLAPNPWAQSGHIHHIIVT
jgi:hypothetical protein